jgi:hypothetical protein
MLHQSSSRTAGDRAAGTGQQRPHRRTGGTPRRLKQRRRSLDRSGPAANRAALDSDVIALAAISREVPWPWRCRWSRAKGRWFRRLVELGGPSDSTIRVPVEGGVGALAGIQASCRVADGRSVVFDRGPMTRRGEAFMLLMLKLVNVTATCAPSCCARRLAQREIPIASPGSWNRALLLTRTNGDWCG